MTIFDHDDHFWPWWPFLTMMTIFVHFLTRLSHRRPIAGLVFKIPYLHDVLPSSQAFFFFQIKVLKKTYFENSCLCPPNVNLSWECVICINIYMILLPTTSLYHIPIFPGSLYGSKTCNKRTPVGSAGNTEYWPTHLDTTIGRYLGTQIYFCILFSLIRDVVLS